MATRRPPIRADLYDTIRLYLARTRTPRRMIAEATGVSSRTLTRIAAGTTDPYWSHLERLASYFATRE